MFYLTQDFHNSDIFEMLGDFFGSLPELLMWLLESALPSLVWIIPTILAVFLLVFLKLYLDVIKERKSAIRELSRFSADIKISAIKSLFNKSDKPDVLIISPKGQKFAIKFFTNTKKRMNICIIDGENALISKNNINAKSSDDNAKKISFPIDTVSADYEKIVLFSPSAAKLTYVKPNGEVAELRDGDIAFGVRFSTKGTLIRFLEEKIKLG